jgi:hypothetical protein
LSSFKFFITVTFSGVEVTNCFLGSTSGLGGTGGGAFYKTSKFYLFDLFVVVFFLNK